MSDTDKTTEQTETTFGTDTTEIMQRYRKALDDAEHIYRTVTDSSLTLLNTAHSAVLELLDNTPGAHDINCLLTTLSQDRRDQLARTAAEARDRMVRHAEDEKAKALENDPFGKYVLDTIGSVGRSFVTTLLNNAPFTFASLRKLADDQDWCSDFETYASRATEAGALPKETRTVTREIPSRYVPDEHGAGYNETWLAHLVLPAYRRDTYRNGRQLDYVDLGHFAESITYEKKPADPEHASDDA